MNLPTPPELTPVTLAVLDGQYELPPEPPDDGYPPDDTASAIERRTLELRGRLLTPDRLREIPPPVPLVEGYLFRDSLAWLGGKPGHAKSFSAVDFACCVGTGHPWHGHDVTPGSVLYLIAEGASGLSLRVDAWAAANGRRVDNVLFLPIPVQLLNALDTAAFTALAAELRPDLVIIDTQARVTVGGEENSSKDMGRFVDSLEHLRRASGACVLVVHHEARGAENLRGSTALEGAATTILRCSKDGAVVEITNTKQKDSPEQPPLQLTLTAFGGSAVLSHDPYGVADAPTESERDLLAILRDTFGAAGATKTELRDASGQAKTTYYRAIGALVAKGLVVQHKEGRGTRYVPAADETQEALPHE